MLISLAEYAQQHGKDAANLRRKCRSTVNFKTARKIGRNWAIDSEEEVYVRPEELPAASIKIGEKRKGQQRALLDMMLGRVILAY